MKTVVPDYYKEFKCIADKCNHTCCQGWEVEIDDESLARFEKIPEINEKIERDEDNHFRLNEGDVCPFLQDNGLCEMIIKYGEDMICQTCRDHPRFRNYWSDRIEMGLGLVCEEAARLVLGKSQPMKLVEFCSDCNMPTGDGDVSSDELPEDEAWLLTFRDKLLEEVKETGPIGRLREYLYYRHIADALYDDRLEERVRFVDEIVSKVESSWENTDGSFETLVEIVRKLSYDVEYDEDVKEQMLNQMD